MIIDVYLSLIGKETDLSRYVLQEVCGGKENVWLNKNIEMALLYLKHGQKHVPDSDLGAEGYLDWAKDPQKQGLIDTFRLENPTVECNGDQMPMNMVPLLHILKMAFDNDFRRHLHSVEIFLNKIFLNRRENDQ